MQLGARLPQQNEQPDKPPRTQCALSALNKNKVSLALDAGAAALTFLAPEASVAAAIAGNTLGLIGIGNSVINKDAPGAGLAFAGKEGALATVVVRTGSNAAMYVGRTNLFVLALSVARDGRATYSDYQRCVAGQ
ncbi:MAG: hypothetical protein ACR2KM_05615 [Gemmatimonadaceae bacterium]